MPTDFAFYYLFQPFGLAMQLALLVVPTVLLRLLAPATFANLGFRRIAFGHLGVAIATFFLAVLSAYSMGRSKVQLGHITSNEFTSWVAGNSVYLFVLTYVFSLAFASLILVPFCVCLSNKNKASLAKLLGLGMALAIALAVLSVIFPSNEWGQEHPLDLFISTLLSLGVGILAVCLAFGLGARLPVRSTSRRNTF